MNHIIKPGSRDLWYPGFRWGIGFRHNLSSYRPQFEDGSAMSFDIERTVSWDSEFSLLPFKYSLMITHSSPAPHGADAIEASRKKFIGIATRLSGFEWEKSDDTLLVYRNPSQQNIFVDWMLIPESTGPRIVIGAIQDEHLAHLGTAIDSLPYAVGVFNQLSPRALEDAVVQESIAIAEQSDKVLPKCRFKENEAYEAYCKRRENERVAQLEAQARGTEL